MITTYYNHKPLAFGQPIFRQTMDPVWRASWMIHKPSEMLRSCEIMWDIWIMKRNAISIHFHPFPTSHFRCSWQVTCSCMCPLNPLEAMKLCSAKPAVFQGGLKTWEASRGQACYPCLVAGRVCLHRRRHQKTLGWFGSLGSAVDFHIVTMFIICRSCRSWALIGVDGGWWLMGANHRLWADYLAI